MQPARKFQAPLSAALHTIQHPRSRGAASFAAAALCLLLAGCGATYRPVVSAINPVGPAAQPIKYAVAVSNTGVNSLGLVTLVDFAGDTTLSTPSLQGLNNPSYFTLNPGGNTGYVINPQGTLDSFSTFNPTALRTIDVGQSTLLAGAAPVSVSPLSGSAGSVLYISQTGRQSVAALSSSPVSLLQELTVGTNPVYVVGSDGSPRVYALSAGTGAGNGRATAIETTNGLPTISATIPVGANPVYGVVSSDLTRAFILNKGSGNVSVINVNTNALDSTTPTIPAIGALGINPIWAEYVPTLSELLVLNAGNGTTPGTLSIISVPECNSVTVATNPNCNAANPTDAIGFGIVVATVPVGVNPSMVSALRDGSRAYVANAANVPGVCGGRGSVSVVNLSTNSVSSTICSMPTPTNGTDNPTSIYGNPNSIAVTLASPTGKVYVTSGDTFAVNGSNGTYMTVIRTDNDSVTTHINLQGVGLRVMVTAP